MNSSVLTLLKEYYQNQEVLTLQQWQSTKQRRTKQLQEKSKKQFKQQKKQST